MPLRNFQVPSVWTQQFHFGAVQFLRWKRTWLRILFLHSSYVSTELEGMSSPISVLCRQVRMERVWVWRHLQKFCWSLLSHIVYQMCEDGLEGPPVAVHCTCWIVPCWSSLTWTRSCCSPPGGARMPIWLLWMVGSSWAPMACGFRGWWTGLGLGMNALSSDLFLRWMLFSFHVQPLSF